MVAASSRFQVLLGIKHPPIPPTMPRLRAFRKTLLYLPVLELIEGMVAGSDVEVRAQVALEPDALPMPPDLKEDVMDQVLCFLR